MKRLAGWRLVPGSVEPVLWSRSSRGRTNRCTRETESSRKPAQGCRRGGSGGSGLPFPDKSSAFWEDGRGSPGPGRFLHMVLGSPVPRVHFQTPCCRVEGRGPSLLGAMTPPLTPCAAGRRGRGETGERTLGLPRSERSKSPSCSQLTERVRRPRLPPGCRTPSARTVCYCHPDLPPQIGARAWGG